MFNNSWYQTKFKRVEFSTNEDLNMPRKASKIITALSTGQKKWQDRIILSIYLFVYSGVIHNEQYPNEVCV